MIAVVQILLGPGFLLLSDRWVKEVLIASIVVSVIIWYCSEAFGMILTGMATDFNSGLLVVVMALACWPKAQTLRFGRAQIAREARQEEEARATERV